MREQLDQQPNISDSSEKKLPSPENTRAELGEEQILELAEAIKGLEAKRDEILAGIPLTKQKKKKSGAKTESDFKFDLGVSNIKDVDFKKVGRDDFAFGYSVGGDEIEITPEKMMTMMNWDVYFDLNSSVPAAYQNKYNKFRHQYIKAFFQKKINKLKNEQMLIQLLEVEDVAMHDQFLAKAYKAILERVQSDEGSEQAGFVFENIFFSFMQRLSMEIGNFKVEEANAVEDGLYKADMKVKIEDDHHGVGVEESETVKGFQLTLRKDLRQKQSQIDAVNKRLQALLGNEGVVVTDLKKVFLLKVGADNQQVMRAYNDWKKSGHKTPDQFFISRMGNVEIFVEQYIAPIFSGTSLDFEANPRVQARVTKFFKEEY